MTLPQKLLHVSDPLRLAAWGRLVALEAPATEQERRLAAMLFVSLYGRTVAARLDEVLVRWAAHATLREEVRQLLPILGARADALPRADRLDPSIPLVLHGRYLDVELSAAFDVRTRQEGVFRNFYTGVEPTSCATRPS